MTVYTILFADIAGSTTLYEKLGDQKAEALINSVLKALSGIVKQQQGEVIKTIGDEIMCQFSDTGMAIQAANLMHDYVSLMDNSGTEQRIAVRIGAHIGQIIRTQNDVFGDTVNVSARIAALARPGKTMISERTYLDLPQEKQLLCRRITETRLKGKSQPMNIYEVIWEQNDQLTRLADNTHTRHREKTLHLRYMDQSIELKQGSLKVGRAHDCDLVVNSSQASRYHCEIQQNGSRFSLTDSSTNGTFVLQNGVELMFHNESVPLHQSGIISLGQRSDGNEDHQIDFSISSTES